MSTMDASQHETVKATDIKPFGERVVVGEIGSVDTIRDSGIVIPASIAERKGLVKGIVLKLGDQHRYGFEHKLEEQDIVFFRENSAYDISGVIVLDMHDIIAYVSSET